MNGRGIGLPALLPGPLLAASCQSGPDMLAAPVMGYKPYVRGDQLVFGEWGGWTAFSPYQGMVARFVAE